MCPLSSPTVPDSHGVCPPGASLLPQPRPFRQGLPTPALACADPGAVAAACVPRSASPRLAVAAPSSSSSREQLNGGAGFFGVGVGNEL